MIGSMVLNQNIVFLLTFKLLVFNFLIPCSFVICHSQLRGRVRFRKFPIPFLLIRMRIGQIAASPCW